MLLEWMMLRLLVQSRHQGLGGPVPPQQEVDITACCQGPGIRCPWPGSQMVLRVLGCPFCSLLPRLFAPGAEAAATFPVL